MSTATWQLHQDCDGLHGLAVDGPGQRNHNLYSQRDQASLWLYPLSLEQELCFWSGHYDCCARQ